MIMKGQAPILEVSEYHYYEKAYYQYDEECQRRDVKTFRQTKLRKYYESIEKYINNNQPSLQLVHSTGA